MELTYDASGSSENFKMSQLFVIFKKNQTIRLKNPAYFAPVTGSDPNYFKVQIVGEDQKTVIATLTMSDAAIGDCYEIVDDAETEEIKADALLACSSQASTTDYNPTIANSIKIKAFDPSRADRKNKFFVLVTYHAVRMSVIDARSTSDFVEDYDGMGPRYSPALMQKVLNRLTLLETAKDQSGSMFGTDLDTHDILEEDITGMAPENFVQYERHDVNTPAGINLVQPSKGSFYPENLRIITYLPQTFTLSFNTRADGRNKLFIYSDTETLLDSTAHMSVEHKVILTDAVMTKLLELTVDEHGNLQDSGKTITGSLVDLSNTAVDELKKDIDYMIDSIDIPRTARSTSPFGVYQHIRFLTSRVGQVLISYQAFGGMVATSDIRAMHQDITNTRAVLKNADLLTVDQLDKQPFIVELNRRMMRMEEFHNHFSQVEHRISTTTTGFHWFTIAALYDVNWNQEMSEINDIGQFRIQSALRKWSYEFMVDFDAQRPVGHELHVKMLGTNQSAGYNPSDYTKALFRDNVAARVCWVDNGTNSGVVLQIGWDFRVYHETKYPIDTDTIVVTNKSSSASMWTLMNDPVQTQHQSQGIINVWNHVKLIATSDKKFLENKPYFVYHDTYLYVRSADKFVIEGRAYYGCRMVDDGTGNLVPSYYEINASNNSNMVPGNSTDVFRDSVTGELNIFERILYGHYPVQVVVKVGENIPSDPIYYEVESVSYQDKDFSMPNTSFIWADRDNDKSCVKLIEPDDGIVGWCGSIDLAQFAPKFGYYPGEQDYDINGHRNKATDAGKGAPGVYSSPLMLSYDLHTYMKPEYITGVTLVLFDRRDGRYIQTRADAAYSEDGSVHCEFPYCLEDMCFADLTISKRAPDPVYNKDKVIPATSRNTETSYEWEFIPTGSKLLEMDLRTFMGTMSLKNDRFDLRQVRLHF